MNDRFRDVVVVVGGYQDDHKECEENLRYSRNHSFLADLIRAEYEKDWRVE